MSMRICSPDEIFVENSILPALLEQFQIEDVSEDNKEKLTKEKTIDSKEITKFQSLDDGEAKFTLKKRKSTVVLAINSNDEAIRKQEFISLTEKHSKETSRSTQTQKTSLGKKSKLRNRMETTEESNVFDVKQNRV